MIFKRKKQYHKNSFESISKYVLVFSVLLLMIYSSTGYALDVTPEEEPNDKVKKAQHILFPSIVKGTIPAKQKDTDCYRLSIPPGGLKSLYIVMALDGSHEVSLALLDEQKTILTKSNFFPAGQGENLTSLLLPQGIYYIQVKAKPGKHEGESSYTLAMDQVPGVEKVEIKQALNKALDYLFPSSKLSR